VTIFFQLILESKIDNIIIMLIKPHSENLAELFPDKLPVDSVEDFVKLNEKLSDNSFRAKLVSFWLNAAVYHIFL
jgi:hypothetical protein